MAPMLPRLATLLVASIIPGASGKGFLVDRGNRSLDADAFRHDVQSALGSVLGCGGDARRHRPAEIEKELQALWPTLPKNAQGRIEARSLRYVAHRYFMEKSSLLMRGFEPTRSINGSSPAEVLSGRVPSYVEAALASRHAAERGFSIEDAAYMVAMLEQLIADSERSLLESVYEVLRRPMDRPLGKQELHLLLEAYMVHWMMGDDQAGISVLFTNRTLLETSFPHWPAISSFLSGQVHALDFARQREPARKPDRRALEMKYTFDDAQQVVGGITQSFASFWESECSSMKQTLISMDKHRTGRVPLSKFYNTALASEWRFGESETYLRELGALDETSSWHGKQVIIPNYIQAASNCIVSSSHYLVCCANLCHNLLGELEAAVGAPVGLPEEILAVVSNMTEQSSLDDDDLPTITEALVGQLRSIAEVHGGKVPLHGRLFAQWLHYVFPHECPFPHKAGTASALAPAEFGGDYIASDEEMKKHAFNDTEVPITVTKDELQWMSQWSEDEELIADYSAELRAPWDMRPWVALVGTVVLLAAAASGVVSLPKKPLEDMGSAAFCKSHIV